MARKANSFFFINHPYCFFICPFIRLNDSPKIAKDFKPSKSMNEPGELSSAFASKKKVNFKERGSKVISFGFANNPKEKFIQTATKTEEKEIEDLEKEDEALDSKLEKKNKLEEKEAEKENQSKLEPILDFRQEEEQLKNNYLTPSCK